MENERLKIFDEDREQIGVAIREEVHRIGYWHEVFHCWFISNEMGIDYIYLQLRSETKKEYPNLLDITVAGHLLENETVQDGIREIKEEVGIDISFQELEPLGVMDYCLIRDDFIDKERANVFLYRCDSSFDDFTLQEEEVAGIVKVELNNFMELWCCERDTIDIKGFRMNKEGNKILFDESVGRDRFVSYQNKFYRTVIQKIKDKI
ncbi:NUDIX hydrolase [Bacillus sp. SD088]|uniref:NUDIX hydrolase n=1 Tax=Bacillus sp. SD088 TaxID=2782012 RepID=UPI001A97A7E5|nr:NUDIX domain-containing protein [Bacillus sp. SD088]MBO0992740.1 NUDIX domain-containing protein [Bacillus sp. SD088]